MRWIDKILRLLKGKQEYKLVVCYDVEVFGRLKLMLFPKDNVRYVYDSIGFHGCDRSVPVLIYGLPGLPKAKLKLIEEMSIRGYRFQMVKEV